MLIFLASFSYGLVDDLKRYQYLGQLQEASGYIGALSELTHELQRERGLSCGVGPDVMMQLEQQRMVVDRVVSQFYQALHASALQDYGDRIAVVVTRVEQKLAQLPDQRRKVVFLKGVCVEQLDWYTELITLGFDSIYRFQQIIDVPVVNRELLVFESFIRHKEEVALMRGFVHSALADGSISMPEKHMILRTQARAHYAEREFLGRASEEEIERFQMFKNSDLHHEPHQLVETLKKTLGDTSISARLWFAEFSRKVDALHEYEQFLIDQLLLKLKSAHQEKTIQHVVNTLLIVIALLMALLVIRYFIRTIEQRTINFVEGEQRFRDINESVVDWIWEVDANGVYTYSNHSVTTLLGYEVDEIIGKTPFDLMPPEEAERAGGVFANILAGKQSIERLQNIHLHKKGHSVVVETNGVPIFAEDGSLQGYRGSDRNITEALEAERAKDDFLASMSHELRTPLTSIIGNSEHLLEGHSGSAENRLKPEVVEILQSIHTAGKNQLALVNDILDMSKIESGKFTIDEAPYDLSALLQDMRGMFEVKAQDAGLKFVLDQKHYESRLLMGDGQRIGQVLINLIGNAIKFTEQGEVSLIAWVDKQKLHLQVRDTGIGMTTSQMEKLFGRFQQADNTITRRFGGTGLGLYISEHLTELMGGKIEVSSQFGAGSIFTMVLPYKPTEMLVAVLEGRPIAGSVLNNKLEGHVLVAEDTPEMQLLERRILESMGLTVTTVSNGQEAVDMVAKQTFDLVLMDMQMPVMGGIEATKTLRQLGYQLPIIALTANVMQKHRDAFNEAGCDGFLGKPIDKQELRKILHQHLSISIEN